MNTYKAKTIKNILSSILVVLIVFLSFITIVNICFYCSYIKTNVRGYSMQPTININVLDPNAKGDKIFVNPHKVGKLNDIVVAKVSWHKDYIIKRIVGMPGDKVEIKDLTTHFALYVNDSLLYTKDKYGENTPFTKTGSYAYYNNYVAFLNNAEFQDYVETENGNSYIKLDENEYFLMGDNWGHTTDSIEKGPITKNEIVGTLELIVDVNNKNPFIPTFYFLKKIFSVN